MPIDVLVDIAGLNEWGEETTEYANGRCRRSLGTRLGYGKSPDWGDSGAFAYDHELQLFHSGGTISSIAYCPTDILFVYYDAYDSIMGTYAYHTAPSSSSMRKVTVRGSEDAARVEAYIVGYRQGDEVWGVPADEADPLMAMLMGELVEWRDDSDPEMGSYYAVVYYKDGEPD